MKTKEKLSLVKLFSGVPMFEKVMNILKSKVFITPDTPRKDGFTTIGLMSPLERACYSVLEASTEKIKALGECKFGHLHAGCVNTVMVELDFCPFAKQLVAIREENPYQKDLRSFMFSLIRSRMTAKHPDLEKISLCEEFRIMTPTKMDPPETIEVFEGMEKMSVEEMLEVSLKGTFLEPVLDVLTTEKFVDDDSPMKEGEEIIREMTSLEKALWTSYSVLFEEMRIKSDKMEKFMEKSDAFHDVGMSIGLGMGSPRVAKFIAAEKGHPDTIEVEKMQQEISVIDSCIDPLNSFLWNIIQSHVPADKQEQYDSTAIRQGFKIVMFNED